MFGLRTRQRRLEQAPGIDLTAYNPSLAAGLQSARYLRNGQEALVAEMLIRAASAGTIIATSIVRHETGLPDIDGATGLPITDVVVANGQSMNREYDELRYCAHMLSGLLTMGDAESITANDWGEVMKIEGHYRTEPSFREYVDSKFQ